MKSIKTQIEELHELLAFRERSDWEHGFITNMYAQLQSAKGDTRNFTEKQVDKIEELHSKRVR